MTITENSEFIVNVFSLLLACYVVSRDLQKEINEKAKHSKKKKKKHQK